ncbi:MAG: hypothetical protein AAF548_15110 [Actinomycetota bacterium]
MTTDQPPLLPAQDLGWSVGTDGAMTPTVVVDAAAHPAVADLARVHAIDGVGDIRTTGRLIDGAGPGGGAVFLLGVTMTSPVRTAFAIAFPMPLAEEFLRQAADAGRLALATTDTHTVETERPSWLAIDLDAESLRGALAGPGS